MTEPSCAKPVTVRFTSRAYDRAREHLLKDARERLCFLFADVVESSTRLIFLVDYVLVLDPACYLRRSRTGVVVDPRAKNRKRYWHLRIATSWSERLTITWHASS